MVSQCVIDKGGNVNLPGKCSYNVAMSLAPGTRLDQYEVLSPIGAGGMGEVYRARDTRLGRDVAIKVLPERLAADSEALERFEREAKALAAISHPNILMIFDFGSDNGVTYAVMELLEGEPLRKKIIRGPIPSSKIVEIGSAITEGLAAAHSRGIIHRDLKPENIFLTAGGGVKILDFGLARLNPVERLEGESRMATLSGTEPGTVLGTIGYMSPEQVRGQALDNRTDIFSLGCILYEMATGRCPFARNTAADTMAAILNHEPPELSATGAEIPPEMDRLILHCLEKNPDDRFQSARDLSFDLKEIASGTRFTRPVRQIKEKNFTFAKLLIAAFALCFILAGFWWFRRIQDKSDSSVRIPVAVADFVNETGEPDLDGLSGMLITSLEQSRKLAVMTRSRMLDVMKQMGQENADRIDEHVGREICKRADVDALILASIRKFDQLYTIDLKVLDPEKNEYLFTTKQQGTGKASVPQLIDQLSEETRKGLNEKAAEIQKASRKVTDVTTSNLAAYQHFFKGEEHINKLQFKEAEQEFRKAVEIDPNFALAYGRMAYAISWSSFDRAQEPIQKTLQLIDKLPEKDQLMLLASKAYIERNLEEASNQLDRYLKLYPDEKEALFTRGDWYYHFGEVERAKDYFLRVLKLDPNFDRASQHLIWSYLSLDEPQKAVEAARQYASNTRSAEAFRQLYTALIQAADYAGAEDTLKRAETIAPDKSDEIKAGRAEILLYTGKYDEAEQICKNILQSASNAENQTIGYGCLANIYAYTGRFINAVEALQSKINLQIQQNELSELPESYSQLSYIYIWGFNDRAQGDTQIKKAMEYAKEADQVQHFLFDTLNMLGRYDDAARIAHQSLWGHRPWASETTRAFRNINDKHYAEAIPDLKLITEKGHTGDRLFARYLMAQCYSEMKQYDRAIEQFQEILSRPISRSWWEYGTIHYELAKAYRLKGDHSSAREHYETLLNVWRLADTGRPEILEARKFVKS